MCSVSRTRKDLAHRSLCLALVMIAWIGTSAQDTGTNAGHEPSAIAMPESRSADSYRIYARAMPLGETGGRGWPNKLWLVQDTTVVTVAPNEPCQGPASPKDDLFARTKNPHFAVRPSQDRKQDFAEILEDWDLHCHDRVKLDPNAWHTTVPVLLLDANAQARYGHSRSGGKFNAEADPYEGAPALYAFSMVYFNRAHTVALLYATHYCGSLCGQGFWLAFAFEDGNWKPLGWKSLGWIS